MCKLLPFMADRLGGEILSHYTTRSSDSVAGSIGCGKRYSLFSTLDSMRVDSGVSMSFFLTVTCNPVDKTKYGVFKYVPRRNSFYRGL